MDESPRIGWTQPLCEACYAAWALGRGEQRREPTRILSDEDDDPCLICGTPTPIYARIDPKLAEQFDHPKRKT